MIQRTIEYIPILFLLGLLTGCAAPAEVRNMTTQTTVSITKVTRALEKFEKTTKAADAELARRIGEVKSSVAKFAALEIQIMKLIAISQNATIAKKKGKLLKSLITQANARTVELRAELTGPEKYALEIISKLKKQKITKKKLKDVAKKLSELSKKGSGLAVIKSLFSYMSKVAKEIEKIKK